MKHRSLQTALYPKIVPSRPQFILSLLFLPQLYHNGIWYICPIIIIPVIIPARRHPSSGSDRDLGGQAGSSRSHKMIDGYHGGTIFPAH